MKSTTLPYENFPGGPCGSVSMRGLLHPYSGLALPEEAVLGLGAGAAGHARAAAAAKIEREFFTMLADATG